MTVNVLNEIVSGFMSLMVTVTGPGASSMSCVAAAEAMTIPAPIMRIRTEGFAEAGDFGGGAYRRASSAPAHDGWFQDDGGAYWVLDAEEVTLEQFGGGRSAASNTTALNKAAAYCAATACKMLRCRVGVYAFASKPDDICEQMKFIGPGSSVCSWLRAYSEAGGQDVGFITLRETAGGMLNGSGFTGIQLVAGAGTTGGTMLREITDGGITGYSLHDDLVISNVGGGTYHRAWLVDGRLNTTMGGQGYRDVRCRGCFFFRGASGTEAVRFLNATNLQAEFWTNGGTVVYGAGSATSNTTNARLTIQSLGELFIGNSTRVATYGEVNSLIHSTGATHCVHWGLVGAGGYSNSGGSPTNKVVN